MVFVLLEKGTAVVRECTRPLMSSLKERAVSRDLVGAG